MFKINLKILIVVCLPMVLLNCVGTANLPSSDTDNTALLERIAELESRLTIPQNSEGGASGEPFDYTALRQELDLLKSQIANTKGEKGNPGNDGTNGVDGLNGQDGRDGTDGQSIKGDKGEKGDQGDKGDTGEKGDRGVAGPLGPQGPFGLPGPQGPDGPEGFPGEKGDTGEKGDPGNDGADGESCGENTCIMVENILPILPSQVVAPPGTCNGRSCDTFREGGQQTGYNKDIESIINMLMDNEPFPHSDSRFCGRRQTTCFHNTGYGHLRYNDLSFSHAHFSWQATAQSNIVHQIGILPEQNLGAPLFYRQLDNNPIVSWPGKFRIVKFDHNIHTETKLQDVDVSMSLNLSNRTITGTTQPISVFIRPTTATITGTFGVFGDTESTPGSLDGNINFGEFGTVQMRGIIGQKGAIGVFYRTGESGGFIATPPTSPGQ